MTFTAAGQYWDYDFWGYRLVVASSGVDIRYCRLNQAAVQANFLAAAAMRYAKTSGHATWVYDETLEAIARGLDGL